MENGVKPIKSVRSPKRYELSPAAELAVRHYLENTMTSRELGAILGLSHQQAINYIGSICRQWVAEGKLVFQDE
jgi:hypothetical protein